MIKNDVKLDYYTLSAILGINNLKNIDIGWNCTGISTDSREIEQGNLFIGLKGENFDGNTKVLEAIRKGASGVVVDKEYYIQNILEFLNLPVIVVDSTLKALHQFANFHRRRFDYPVIAIGASNGKTTTKEFTASVLSQKFNVLKTQSNYNNQVGVPLTLLQMNNEYDMAVIEAGTNEPGEMSILSSLIEPTHGLITNIGKEHLEKLIDLDGVEMEETFLFGHLKKHNGTAFINYDDERLSKYSMIMDNKVTYGTKTGSDVIAEISLNETLNPTLVITYDNRKISANLKTSGYVTGLNALAAATIGLYFDLSDEEIITGLESYQPDDSHGYGRMLFSEISGIKIINDCYNANPDSMMAGLDSLLHLSNTGNKYPVLGDIRELGDASENEHLQILKYASENFSKIYITGTEMLKAFLTLNLPFIHHYNDKEELAKKLVEIAKPSDAILIKGSRGMAMEKIAILFSENIKK